MFLHDQKKPKNKQTKTLGKKKINRLGKKIFAAHLTKRWFSYYIVSSYEKIRKMVKRHRKVCVSQTCNSCVSKTWNKAHSTQYKISIHTTQATIFSAIRLTKIIKFDNSVDKEMENCAIVIKATLAHTLWILLGTDPTYEHIPGYTATVITKLSPCPSRGHWWIHDCVQTRWAMKIVWKSSFCTLTEWFSKQWSAGRCVQHTTIGFMWVKPPSAQLSDGNLYVGFQKFRKILLI